MGECAVADGARRGRHARAGWLAGGMACLSLLAGCGEPAPGGGDAAGGADTPSARLQALVEGYYDRYLELDPLVATANGDPRFNDRLPNSLGEQWLADMLAVEQEALAALEGIDPSALEEADRLTHEQFRRGRTAAIRGFRFPVELLPFSQFDGLPVFLGQLAVNGLQPFQTVKDYEDFLARLRAFPAWIDQAIANMRDGIAREIVQPRVVVERMLPQVESFLVATPSESVFHAPLAQFPSAVPDADRVRLARAYEAAIAGELLPAYRRLHRFLADEYLPAARESVGMSALPNGSEWYAYLVQLHTTTDLTPDEIHETGLAEVERLAAEMDALRARLGFDGGFAAFAAFLRSDPRFRFETPEQLLDAYLGLEARIAPTLPQLFARAPAAALEIREVEPFRSASAAAASYLPAAPDGTRPGVFYVNTHDLPSRPAYMIESLFLHEAIPGHHFQVSLQQENTRLPRFRRFGADTAFVEGWALYAESLGHELGLYQDPYQQFGALAAAMWRAARLVVDTGLHSRDWTYAQAVDYLRTRTVLGEADVVAEVERYIALPGQALAYRIGERRIRALRERAERALGGDFDIAAFHEAILADGSLALDVLDAKMARWEAARNPLN